MPQNPPHPPLGFFDRFRAIPKDMRTPIYDRLERGEKPLEIHRWLTQTYKHKAAEPVPSQRTIERAYAVYREIDNGSGPWSVVTATDGEEARLGLRILGAVVEATEHRRLEVSQRAMRAAVAVLRARDGLDPWEAYLVGRAYLSRLAQKRSTSDLDVWLADPDLYERVSPAVFFAMRFPRGMPRAEKVKHTMTALGLDASDVPEGDDAGRQPKGRTKALNADERERLAALRRHDEAMQQAAGEQYERESAPDEQENDDGKA